MTPPTIYVCGDAMLDVAVRRPEYRRDPAAPAAPVVPVVRPDRDAPGVTFAAGGAANVAVNAAALGAEVVLIAAIGHDPAGDRLRSLLYAAGVAIVSVPGTGTTVKATYYRDDRPVVRVDTDHTADPDALFKAGRGLRRPDALVLTDYGRGCLDRPALEAWCGLWTGVPVYGDPKAGRCHMWTHTPGLAALVLNRDEAADFLPGHAAVLDGATDDRAALVLHKMFRPVRVPTLVLKRGPYGSSFAQTSPQTPVNAPGAPIGPAEAVCCTHVPVISCGPVVDVQGAGDSYIAALAVARVRGAGYEDACLYASAAAGVAVARPGTTVVAAADVTAALRPFVSGRRGLVAYADAVDLARRLRACGVVVGYTGGCFDLRLSPGHRHTLVAARAGCDFLFVGVDADARVRNLKGPSRPVLSELERATAVAETVGVGAAFVFDTDAPAVVADLKPDVLFKGGDYAAETMPEVPVLRAHGGRFVHTGEAPCRSTTELISQLAGR